MEPKYIENLLRRTVDTIQKTGRYQATPITFEALQKAWADAGYPREEQDLRKILSDNNIPPDIIDKMFEISPAKSPKGDSATRKELISNLADMIKKYNLEQQVIAYIEKNHQGDIQAGVFGAIKSKAKDLFTTEEIKYIFETAIKETQSQSNQLRQQQISTLGRSKK